MPSIAALTLAPWSLSKVQCALRCPLEFHYRYVLRAHEPEVAPETRLGKALHGALEQVLAGTSLADAMAGRRGDLLSDEERDRYDTLGQAVGRFGERIATFRTRKKVGRELIEHRVAVAFDLSPVEFTARDAFFRGVWDAGYVFEDGGAVAVVDHKTGMRRPGADYHDQLKGYAVLAAAHLGSVRRIWLGLHFLVDAALEWFAPVEVETVRRDYAPELVASIEEAARAAQSREPRPSTWCRRCSYRSICKAYVPVAELPETRAELVEDVPKE